MNYETQTNKTKPDLFLINKSLIEEDSNLKKQRTLFSGIIQNKVETDKNINYFPEHSMLSDIRGDVNGIVDESYIPESFELN